MGQNLVRGREGAEQHVGVQGGILRQTQQGNVIPVNTAYTHTHTHTHNHTDTHTEAERLRVSSCERSVFMRVSVSNASLALHVCTVCVRLSHLDLPLLV